jgi:hypothetical protein
MKLLIRNKNILKGRLPGCKILKIVLYTENSWIFLKLMCFCSWIYTYIYNQFQMSWDRCHKDLKFEQTSFPNAPYSMLCTIFREILCRSFGI